MVLELNVRSAVMMLALKLLKGSILVNLDASIDMGRRQKRCMPGSFLILVVARNAELREFDAIYGLGVISWMNFIMLAAFL
jgi:hypothetical protein